jgi:exopolyphosphatase/pppGpp-phosphohydrolase
MGVASSFSSFKGLVMDLGGGSTQLTDESGERRSHDESKGL